jgi:hypothetical protein
MQWAQPHPSTAAKLPCRPPIMCLQIIPNWNLPLQLVECFASHGLSASGGRIRHNALRSQARMVGLGRRGCSLLLYQHHTLSNRRQHHRRTVDGSGKREGSLQCGAACSATWPELIRSHACWRHRNVKGANGISHCGRMVKVFRHGWQMPRRTQTRWRRSSFASRSRRPWPMMVRLWHSGHIRGRSSSGITPVQACLASQVVR